MYLENYLLHMMAHEAFAEDAFANTEHSKNQDDQAKACIARTAFASSTGKSNHKSEEELKQQETSTRNYSNAVSVVDLISTEKKVEHALYANSELMMPMPAIRPTSIHGSYLHCLVCSTNLKLQWILRYLQVLF